MTHSRAPHLIAVCTTLGTRADAERLAHTMIERRLAACAQVSEIASTYRWKGVVHSEAEWRVLLKTTSDRYAAVESAMRELHTYDLPAIYALPVAAAYGPYAEWVEAESRGPE